MPNKVEKFLRKLGRNGRVELDAVVSRITAGDFTDLDIKKLGGFDNKYRIRKGAVRIQFSLNEKKCAVNLDIQWRSDTTYR
ncbi:MAG: hypothetical protein G01um101417_134 [Parcubacteria group bacterium Gr01-1014_17]|nr:MAG: hypothetical protein G01um101417_134 [Parcubacteria group bacterium Gr01-1014_17]